MRGLKFGSVDQLNLYLGFHLCPGRVHTVNDIVGLLYIKLYKSGQQQGRMGWLGG